jgi:hypothetical protein
MNPEEFSRLVRSLAALPRESEWIELKHNNADPQKIGENVSAVSNGAALLRKPMGYVLWGVHDDSHDLVASPSKCTSFQRRTSACRAITP